LRATCAAQRDQGDTARTVIYPLAPPQELLQRLQKGAGRGQPLPRTSRDMPACCSPCQVITSKEFTMAKTSAKASRKVGKVMHEYKQGSLRSGASGRKVTSRKQAVAIGLSEARKSGAKVAPRKRASH
jgi:Family of unknown function (DUF6496)